MRPAKKRSKFGLKFLRKQNVVGRKKCIYLMLGLCIGKGETHVLAALCDNTNISNNSEMVRHTHLRYSPTREKYPTIRNIQIYISAT